MQDTASLTLFAWTVTVLVAVSAVPPAAAQPPDVVDTCPTLEGVLPCSGADNDPPPQECEHHHDGGQVVDSTCWYNGQYCPVFVSVVHPHEFTCI